MRRAHEAPTETFPASYGVEISVRGIKKQRDISKRGQKERDIRERDFISTDTRYDIRDEY